MPAPSHTLNPSRRPLRALLAGAAVMALLAGPAGAHEWNGNPDPTNPADPTFGRHDVTVSKAVNLVRSKPDGCSYNTMPPYGPACATLSSRSNAGDGSTTAGSNTITNASGFFMPTDVARTIISPTFPNPTFITTFISSTSVTISGENGAPATVTGTAPFTVLDTNIEVSAPTFGGTPGQGFTVMLCNAKRAAPTDEGGDNDPTGGCDFANGRGLSPIPGFPASSGSFTLDGSGNVTGGVGNVPADGKIPLTPTSCNGATGSLVPDLLTAIAGPTCNNANATTTCPPTAGQIAGGWTCVVPVAEFDPVALTTGTHVGFRVVNMKSPIPSKLCNNVACGALVAAGTTVKLTGVRFPCKTIQPDDPVATLSQRACLVAHTDKQILVKRVLTAHIELNITPTSQTAGVNGDYTITFTMPALLHPGELYKLIPHAQVCPAPGFNQGPNLNDPNVPNSCESGLFNAAGASVRQ